MIDEKGRIFGKINVIDLLVILVIVIGVIFVGTKFLGKDGGASGGGGGTHVTYTVLVEGVQPEVYENIKGMLPSTLMASGELLDGQVIDVTSTPHQRYISFNPVSNTLDIPTELDLLDLTFTIECNVVNNITTEIGTQEVRIGKSHIVKTDTFELTNGIILSCERQPNG